MSKELKIIESYYPPSNINAIWYDRRGNKLKKVVNHQWVEIGEAPVKLPDMPGDDEIWFHCRDSSESINRENLKKWISTTIKRIESDWDLSDCETVKVFLEKGDGENVKITLDDTAIGIDRVYLPLNLKTIQPGQVRFFYESPIFYLSKNVTSIENGAIYGMEAMYANIYCAAEYPPVLDSNGITGDYIENVSHIVVTVPGAYVNTYKSATNWSEFRINPYNEEDYDY